METTTAAPSIEMIELRSLSEHPQNPRKTFDAERLAELVESVRQQGILNPLLVRPLDPAAPDGGYQILAGARRFRAAAKAGLPQVPAIVRDLDDTAAFEVVVIDNLQRADLHPLEEAYGYHQLMRPSVGYSVGRVADRVGRSISYVYDRLKLLSLTKEAQQLFREGAITTAHAVILARLTPADQKRAIGKPGEGPLLERERTLFDPTDKSSRDSVKPISVRELQAWVDKHVRFDATAADPMLFPDTVEAVQEAKEEELKIVPITHDHNVIPSAKDGSRTYGPQSWRRAGGAGSKKCDRAVQGVIVVGPGRGQAFPVCIDKKKCAVHWGKEQRAAKKRAGQAAKGGTTGEDRWRIEQRKREEERKREEAESARWRRAVPTILEAIATSVKKAPVRARGQLADLILRDVRYTSYGALPLETVADLVPLGQTAEDLVRHVGFVILANSAQEYVAHRSFPRVAKAFGVDARKILDEVAPEPKEPAAAAAPAKKTRKAAKKARGRRG